MLPRADGVELSRDVLGRAVGADMLLVCAYVLLALTRSAPLASAGVIHFMPFFTIT